MGKKFGQHFLTDQQVVSGIMSNFNPSGPVIEVGPGKGALTHFLLKRPNPLLVVEIDNELQVHWQKRSEEIEHLQVLAKDVLSFDWNEWTQWQQGPFAIISNLPYEISGPFLIRLAKNTHLWHECLLMLQYEIVQKVIAKPGTSHCGRLSVQLQRHCHVHAGDMIAPSSFSPPPRVNSQLLMLKPRAEIEHVDCETTWDNMLRIAFCSRRQMLRRTFKPYDVLWDDLSIDGCQRPENLSVSDWVRLCNYLSVKGLPSG